MIQYFINSVLQLFYFISLKKYFKNIDLLLIIVLIFISMIILTVILIRSICKRKVQLFLNKVNELFIDVNILQIIQTQTVFRKRLFCNDFFYLAFSEDFVYVFAISKPFDYLCKIEINDISRMTVVEKLRKDDSDIVLSVGKDMKCPLTYTLPSSSIAAMVISLLDNKINRIDYYLEGRKVI